MDINKMTLAERIHEFWTRHEVIDTTLVPDLWITWTGKRNKKEYRKYYQLSTGTVTEDTLDWVRYDSQGKPSYYGYYKDDNLQGIGHGQIKTTNRLLLNANSDCNYYYFKYDDELEIIEISVVTIDTHRYNSKLSVEENTRVWVRNSEYTTFFMEKGSKEKYDIDGNIMEEYYFPYKWMTVNRVHCTNFDGYLKEMRRMNTLRTCAKEFERFASGSLYGACGRALNPLYTYDLEDWFRRDVVKKNKGVIGKKIDDLCSKPMKSLDYLKDIYKEEPSDNRYYHSGNDIIYIDLEVEKDWAVLRYLFRRNDGGLDESYRVMVHNNGKILLARRIGPNNWTTATNISSGWRGSKGKIVNYEEMKNHKRLSYIADMVSTFPENSRLGRIITILRNPVAEQLYKAGYVYIAKDLLVDNEFNKHIKNMFGECNLKEKNLFAKFGVNKAQMDILEEYFKAKENYNSSGSYYSRDYGFRSIEMIKSLFETKDISHIDEETFRNLVGMINMMGRSSYSVNIREQFGLPEHLGYNTQQQIKIWLKLYRIALKYQKNGGFSSNSRDNNVFYLLRDTISVYNKFPESMRPAFDIAKVDSYSDVVRLHDGITNLYNAMRTEIMDANNKEKEEKMRKLDEKRKKVFEAEDNEFLIRLPLKLSEIVEEGSKLSHCVGGYTDRHATGSTTILFLRKKSEANKPFYTIECHGTDPKKGITVSQIHGHCNKWLGNNPEAIPFVLRWLRDKGIQCRDEIVLSTAKGYSGYGAAMIPKPEI